MSENQIIFISSQEAGERLDKVLAKRFSKSKSRTYFQSLIKEGLVLLNGKVAKKREILKEGDEIEIEFALTPEIQVTPENIPLNVLYEDQHLLAVNKPCGMVVHPAPGNWTKTFVNALLYYCKNLEKTDEVRPGIVHRLDKDTSGVLLAAKTKQVHAALVSMFSLRKIQKTYLAVCIGNPKEGEINAPIGRHPIKRKQMHIDVSKGKESITSFKTLSYNARLSFVELKPKTGRTHQLRVHMKYHKTPILGDLVYGNEVLNKKFNVKRQLLHAYSLIFDHPITGKTIEIKASLPEDMQILLEKEKLL